jgi:hypothetical protein
MSQDPQRLHRSEARAYAHSGAASEGQILKAVAVALLGLSKSLMVESVRILPQRWAAMNEPGPDRYDIARRDLFTTEPVCGDSLPVEARNRWVQAQGLLDHPT